MLLRKGDSGASVEALQTLLNKNGYQINIDGDFGNATDALLRDFQKQKNLNPDGIAGATTFAHLKPKKEFMRFSPLLENVAVNVGTPIKQTGVPAEDVLINIRNWWGNIINEFAKAHGIDTALLLAVIAIETNGIAYSEKRVVIRFENHVFSRQNGMTPELYKTCFYHDKVYPWKDHKFRPYRNDVWKSSHIWTAKDGLINNQRREFEAFDVACAIHVKAAYNSISMGLPQIMGFNAHLVGYDSAMKMYESFHYSAKNQILAFFDFILGVFPTQPMIQALKTNNIEYFVRQYNGSGQVESYTKKIKNSVNTIKKLGLINEI